MTMTMKSRGTMSATLGKIPAPVVAPDPGLRMAIQLCSPIEGKFRDYIDQNRDTPNLQVARPGMYTGQTLALCGAGPSLRTADITGVDHIFACNSALPYLISRGVTVTGAVGIDQSPGLLREWESAPDVPYFVGSSCDPMLIQHLTSRGRELYFFHNAVGIDDEIAYYTKTWPATCMVGHGFTVVSRFIGLAFWLGFERIDVYGADCALTSDDVAHANGEHVSDAYYQPLLMRGEIRGREWRTRPDMMMDAVELARLARIHAGKLRLMGDTLPVALLGKDDAFLDQVCRTLGPGEVPPLPTTAPE